MTKGKVIKLKGDKYLNIPSSIVVRGLFLITNKKDFDRKGFTEHNCDPINWKVKIKGDQLRIRAGHEYKGVDKLRCYIVYDKAEPITVIPEDAIAVWAFPATVINVEAKEVTPIEEVSNVLSFLKKPKVDKNESQRTESNSGQQNLDSLQSSNGS